MVLADLVRTNVGLRCAYDPQSRRRAFADPCGHCTPHLHFGILCLGGARSESLSPFHNMALTNVHDFHQVLVLATPIQGALACLHTDRKADIRQVICLSD